MSMPISRNTDPLTSHAAALRYEVLGKRAERQWQTLALVNEFPRQTSGELSRHMAKSYPHLPIAVAVETPHKRLADLEKKGLVSKGPVRVCRDSGYERHTWWITRLGRQQLGLDDDPYQKILSLLD